MRSRAILSLSYSGLEVSNFFVSQRVSLGNDGNEVDAGVQSTHEFNVNLLETAGQGEEREKTRGKGAYE